MNWDKKASNDLKAEIARHGLTYSQVVNRLAESGIQMSSHAFTKKINRGGFSHAFFLQCIEILSGWSSSPKKTDNDRQGA
jgi:hypothetical protein